MPSPERYYAVWLNAQKAGVLHVRGDYTYFVLDRAYVDDPERAVLGLQFEQDLRARHSANMRLPPWFSNLLPEGRLREWIAAERGVAVDREMQLLAQIGHDLPGAVRVLAADEPLVPLHDRERQTSRRSATERGGWRFSLAGVQMKFSMLQRGDRFTAPAHNEDGDWIVKLPDATFDDVPRNEHAMMELGRRAGLDVPETRLVHRGLIEDVPASAWPRGEEWAFAVRRFDRAPGGLRIHMEDLAQVRGFYPGREKYLGTYETVASLIYRGRDLGSLRELTRRLAFHVLIRNGDAHLKNWSLLYRDPRVPVLSPAYDLVATSVYRSDAEDLALKLGGSRRFEDVSYGTFAHLGRRLGVDGAALAGEAEATVEGALAAWPAVRDTLLADTTLRAAIDPVIRASSAALKSA